MAIVQSFSVLIEHIFGAPQFPLYAAVVVLLLTFWLRPEQDDLPELNPRMPPELTDRRRILDFIRNSKTILQNGRVRFKDKPYKVMSEWGRMVVLPPECVDELRSDPRMYFTTPVTDVSFKSYAANGMNF